MPPPGDPTRMEASKAREVLPVAGCSSDSLDTSYVAVVDGAGIAFSATPSDPNADSPVVAGVGCVVSPRGAWGWLVGSPRAVVAVGRGSCLPAAPAFAVSGGLSV